MKTIIKIKTWSCQCGYHQDCPSTPENMLRHFGYSQNICPSCKQHPLSEETNPDKKTTITIMGEEDIEDEILRDDEEKIKQKKIKMSGQEKENYRLKRKQDIQNAITKGRLLEDL